MIYSTGTADFTNASNTVTGTGTAWVANVRPGYLIRGADGQMYAVITVVSNTQITIFPAYASDTETGASYFVSPTTQGLLDLEQTFLDIGTDFQDMLDTIGEGEFPDGNASAPGLRFTDDPDNGARRVSGNFWSLVAGGNDAFHVRDANPGGSMVQTDEQDATQGLLARVGAFGWGLDDTALAVATSDDLDAITVNGLWRYINTTGSSPNQAGVALHLGRIAGEGEGNAFQLAFDVNDQLWHRRKADVAGWDPFALIYSQATLLGGVSESAGVPTGALIERGSNANGEYVRFADGLQICQHTLTLAYASIARLELSWTFPAEFDGTSLIDIRGLKLTGNVNATCTPDLTELTDIHSGTLTRLACTVTMRRVAGLTNFDPADTLDVPVMAIGRWF